MCSSAPAWYTVKRVLKEKQRTNTIYADTADLAYQYALHLHSDTSIETSKSVEEIKELPVYTLATIQANALEVFKCKMLLLDPTCVVTLTSTADIKTAIYELTDRASSDTYMVISDSPEHALAWKRVTDWRNAWDCQPWSGLHVTTELMNRLERERKEDIERKAMQEAEQRDNKRKKLMDVILNGYLARVKIAEDPTLSDSMRIASLGMLDVVLGLFQLELSGK